MQNKETLSIIQKSKGKLPRLPFASMAAMKDTILGKTYELSVAYVDAKTSQTLNKQFRGKNYPTNILSFELSKNSGELIIHLPKVAKDAPEFGRSYSNFFAFLLIHGMLHLKGYAHGSTMEGMEKKFQKKFGI